MKMLLLLVRCAVLGLVSYGLYTVLKVSWTEYRENFAPHRKLPVTLPMAYQQLNLSLVNLAANLEPKFYAYFKPPQNKAVIILIHGTEGDRNQLLPEAKMLGDQGFGVLLLDLPGHGDSEGPTTWPDPEQKRLRAVLDWLDTRGGQEEQWRYGILGFSMGTWPSLKLAELDSRVKALALTGAFADYYDLIRHHSGRKSWLVSAPLIMVNAALGFKFWTFPPMASIARLSPHQAVLLISGQEDTMVPPAMTSKLAQAAAYPVQIQVLPHAKHGTYSQDDPDLYQETLTSFFTTHL